MKDTNYPYRSSLGEIAQGLNELMADLEDIRDEAQECLDETAAPTVLADIDRIDAALKTLDEAADLLDTN